jgi:hypothetical protein
MGTNPLLSVFFLLMAVAGAIGPWTYNILAIQELGRPFTVSEFVLVGFQGSAILGSVATDFWIAAIVATLWITIEAHRLKMKFWWAFLPLSLGVAIACALPLFLFLRERALAKA